MKAAAEKVLVEAEAENTVTVKQTEASGEVDDGVMVATTSYMDSKVQCCNCSGDMTPSHQCEVLSETVSVVEDQPPPLPLCHYCCHLKMYGPYYGGEKECN